MGEAVVHGRDVEHPGPSVHAVPAGSAVPAGHGLPRSQRVLIVEDEPAMLRALRINLRARGYEVTTAAAGRSALTEATRRPPDAVLLDLGLPDVDGVAVIRQLRTWSRAPVIVLSGRTGSGDKIGALDAGANDYVTKPFDIEELLARLRAALRRDEPIGATDIMLGRWRIDLVAYTATRADGPAHGGPADGGPADGGPVAGGDGSADGGNPLSARLTPTEWRLLEILLRHPGQLVPASRLLTDVWGPGYERSTNYLRFHMAKLRRKLEEDPSRPRFLLTEPGMGYRYQPDGVPPGRRP
jgi:two-component system KDP operon response regulator KdpE